MTLVGGCSSGVSRFDFPSFGLTRSDPAPLADPNATASLPPVPQESVYAQGGPNAYQGGSYSRSSLPPASQPYTQATPAAYSPPGASLKPERSAYEPPSPAPRPNLAKVRAVAEPERGGEIYKVQAGDTPRSIAQMTGVSEKALIERNDLAPTRLRIGQTLYLPKGGKAPVAPRAVAANQSKPAPDVRVVKTTTIEPPGQREKSQPAAKAQAAPAPAVASSDEVIGGQNPQVASTQQLPAPEPMSGNSFRWPVQGRIISEFGTKPDGGHNDGIDVAVPMGTSVKAAENGVVAYAGDELKGYGNLVLIRHSNNWVSAYAHNDEILVKRGDQVRRGQVIAKAGRSGQVNQPQLHFELRKGSRPVDPTKYMTHATADAD
ncbi:peptidoglycan DD-metalloendopeptidase family protein [Methyloceanibacter sp.]|uniref:peptidoglycan DD-metalloendopeptidase family protein n=1 Tax=Methyloceanibacter sp. TaxID=1965321 RepID=UPI003D6CAB39